MSDGSSMGDADFFGGLVLMFIIGIIIYWIFKI